MQQMPGASAVHLMKSGILHFTQHLVVEQIAAHLVFCSFIFLLWLLKPRKRPLLTLRRGGGTAKSRKSKLLSVLSTPQRLVFENIKSRLAAPDTRLHEMASHEVLPKTTDEPQPGTSHDAAERGCPRVAVLGPHDAFDGMEEAV